MPNNTWKKIQNNKKIIIKELHITHVHLRWMDIVQNNIYTDISTEPNIKNRYAFGCRFADLGRFRDDK